MTAVYPTDRENGPSANERYQITDNSFIMQVNVRSGSMRNLNNIQARFTRDPTLVQQNAMNSGMISPLGESQQIKLSQSISPQPILAQ